MTALEPHIQNIRMLLEFKEFQNVLKSIIDLTIDTRDIGCYQKTNNFLDWLDQNPTHEEQSNKLSVLLEMLYENLKTKPIEQPKILIKAEGLTKTYSSKFNLGPIDLTLKTGEIIGLVGENGNGKTTLLRLLCNDLFISEGSLTYHIDAKNAYDLRTQLVYIPQRTPTWYGSVMENLQFAAASYGTKPEENRLLVDLVLARLGLRKFRFYDWKNLSSGYKMRFELARMLLRKPKVMLIDEPLANLDIIAQQTVLEDFKSIAKSLYNPIGIVLSSQQLYEVEKTADEVIFLKNGLPKNLNNNDLENNNDLTNNNDLVIEFDSKEKLEVLQTKFSVLQPKSLHTNGGTYIITLENTSINQFFETILAQNIELTYFRNITNSTRKFFVA